MARQIPLKRLVAFPNEKDPLHYKDLLRQIISQPADLTRGINYEEMKISVDLLAKIEAAGDTLILEDAEWSNIVSRVTKFPWSVSNAEIFGFMEDMREAKTIKLEPVPDDGKVA